MNNTPHKRLDQANTHEEAAARFKVYPSGFLGSGEVGTTRPIDMEKIRNRLFDLSAITNPDGHTANIDVVRLWDDTIFGSPEYKEFEFKERILKIALPAFGTAKILDWIQLQRNSPYYGDYHEKWIDETLMYVFAGRPRTLSIHNWTTLLQMVDTHNIETDSEITKHFFFGKSLNKPIPKLTQIHQIQSPNLLVTDFIGQWVQRKGGIDDLVCSLHVLFGKR